MFLSDPEKNRVKRKKLEDIMDKEEQGLSRNVADSEKLDDSRPTINFDPLVDPIKSRYPSNSPNTPSKNKWIKMKTYQNPYMKRRNDNT